MNPSRGLSHSAYFYLAGSGWSLAHTVLVALAGHSSFVVIYVVDDGLSSPSIIPASVSGSSVLIESILGSLERVRCLSCQFNKSVLPFLSPPCDIGTRMPPKYPFANAYEHGPSIPRTNENEWVCGRR
ncbi:hypothetical protein ALC53_13561 [Atta colombica]|uniref:Uncharacterized protein n=1 Tax=Atta colombica TaxID=520822 RepID=A0A195AV71_9HYME|nr:hypothetical protein ALC53_13561 [Atta colombica]